MADVERVTPEAGGRQPGGPGPRAALLLLAVACGGAPAATRSPGAQFDALWQDFDATYPYFVEKAVDWAAARDSFRPRALAARTEGELAGVLLEMLGLLSDRHVGLRDPLGRWRPSYAPAVAPNYDLAVDDVYRSAWGTKSEGNWGHGMIGAVPYLYVADWSAPLAGLDAFLEAMGSVPGMVVDVRMNPGGNGQYALDLASRFSDRTWIAGYVRYRNGPGHSDFTAPEAGTVSPGGARQFTGPVLLLVGPGSLSSTEDFVSAMRALPTVTLAGAATGGSTGNPAHRPLDAGWSYSVSQWFFTTPDGLVVEGHGIPVHHAVPATPADFAAGSDPVLDFAIAWAASPTVLRTP